MARRRDPWGRTTPLPALWLRDHLRVARESLHYVSSRLGTSLLVWLLVGIALASPAGLMLLQMNLQNMTQDWEGRPGLSVYFAVGESATRVAEFADALQRRSAITSVKVITEDEALAEFREFSALGDTLTLLDTNPLPASVRGVMAPDADTEDLEAVAEFARGATGVHEVVVERAWLERLTDISQVVSRLGLILGLLFGLGAVLVTSASVRLAIEARLEELRVLKLVGATDGQIRRPFLYFGGFYGLGGGIVAAMLIAITLLVLETPLTSLLGSYDQDLHLTGFDPTFLAGLLLVGCVLGIVGAIVAARSRLRELEVV